MSTGLTAGVTPLNTYKDDIMKKLSIFKVVTANSLALMIAAVGIQSIATTTSAHATTPNKLSTNSQIQLTTQATRIQRALANNNYASIVNDIHPTRGVRFSMYGYVQPKSDKVFSRKQYAQYLKESKIRFTWGSLDGTGELFVVSLPTYLRTWIKAKDFEYARVDVNDFVKQGNKINNIREVYPKADVVEYYADGSDEYEGMDWRIMRLVFENYKGKRYLVGIVNNQSTV